MFFFFFSSRRRHTRYWRDWSSDVCSSDLTHHGPNPRDSSAQPGRSASLHGCCRRGEAPCTLLLGVDHWYEKRRDSWSPVGMPRFGSTYSARPPDTSCRTRLAHVRITQECKKPPLNYPNHKSR